jgi:hypothetical protein
MVCLTPPFPSTHDTPSREGAASFGNDSALTFKTLFVIEMNDDPVLRTTELVREPCVGKQRRELIEFIASPPLSEQATTRPNQELLDRNSTAIEPMLQELRGGHVQDHNHPQRTD